MSCDRSGACGYCLQTRQVACKPLALELLTEAAEHPECDELFARVPELSPSERRAMIERDRVARASWGDASLEEETDA